MAYPDLDAARALHDALQEFFAAHRGGYADEPALRRVGQLCVAARLAVDDAGCRLALRAVESHAMNLFSDEGHRSWDHSSLPGADFVRLRILNALSAFRNRLDHIETERTAAEASPPRNDARL